MTPVSTVARTGTIDCDVHCSVPVIDALFEHLEEPWVGFIREAMFTAQPPALRGCYPPGAGTTAGPLARSAPVTPGTSLPVLREHVLDPGGARYAILNCFTGFDAIRNPDLNAALLRAVNDWLVAEWLEQDERLRASILVSALDIDAGIAEIERLGPDPRFVQVLLPVRSPEPYGKRRFHPLWEAATKHDLVVGIHAWGVSGNPPTPNGFPAYYLEDYLANSGIAQAQLTSLVLEGTFDRFPQLRVAFLECGFTWLPSLLWRLDKEWKGMQREVPWVKRRPSEYVHEHIRFSLEPAHPPTDPSFNADVWDLLERPELVMFSSDYPHDHGGGADALLDALDDAARAGVESGNAAAFYNLDLG